MAQHSLQMLTDNFQLSLEIAFCLTAPQRMLFSLTVASSLQEESVISSLQISLQKACGRGDKKISLEWRDLTVPAWFSSGA